MKKIMKIAISICLTMFIVMVMTSCDDEESHKRRSRDRDNDVKTSSQSHLTDKDYSIMRASDYFGIAPSTVYDEFDGFNNTVSLSQAMDYADYIESCGFTEDTETENKHKDDFDFIKCYVGKTKAQFVTVSYLSGIVSVGYGADCTFKKSDSAYVPSNDIPTTVDVPDIDDTSATCPLCNGSGKVVCSSCHGTGKLYTTGYAPDFTGDGGNSYQVGHTCANCSGSGQSMCTGCYGTGQIN